MVYHNNYYNNDYDIHANNLLCLDARINGHILLSLNESRLERFNVSFGFQLAIATIIEDLVCDIDVTGFEKTLCKGFTQCTFLVAHVEICQSPNFVILGQTNLITTFSGFQISKSTREEDFYFIF